MAEIEIVPAEGRRWRREFLELPYRLYRSCTPWVPPLRLAQKAILDTRRHPFYEHAETLFLLARSGGRTVGRVAAIWDRNHVEYHQEPAGYFGFLECEPWQEAATALLESAWNWLKAQGATIMRGPMNPSTNYECGLLVDGFDSRPAVMMTYNPPYYPALVEGAGLRPAKDLLAYWVTHLTVAAEKVQRVAGKSLEQARIQVRPISKRRLEEEAARVWAIYNSAWSGNWGYTPMSKSEFLALARELKAVMAPRLALVAEKDGRAVGFALAVPDVNQALFHARGRLFPFGLFRIIYQQRHIRSIRVIALGVDQSCRSRGVAAGLYAALIRNGLELGYQAAEMSWVLEDNLLMRRSIEALGGRVYKRYRIYERT